MNNPKRTRLRYGVEAASTAFLMLAVLAGAGAAAELSDPASGWDSAIDFLRYLVGFGFASCLLGVIAYYIPKL